MSIEGIQDGWELVRIGRPAIGEFIVSHKGEPKEVFDEEYCGLDCVIIRKIEKPKRYRPFANAAEFEPHRDRWLVFFDYEYSDLSDQKSRVLVYGDDRFWIGEDGSMYDWNKAFKSWQFEDGTPFGVEVTE